MNGIWSENNGIVSQQEGISSGSPSITNLDEITLPVSLHIPSDPRRSNNSCAKAPTSPDPVKGASLLDSVHDISSSSDQPADLTPISEGMELQCNQTQTEDKILETRRESLSLEEAQEQLRKMGSKVEELEMKFGVLQEAHEKLNEEFKEEKLKFNVELDLVRTEMKRFAERVTYLETRNPPNPGNGTLLVDQEKALKKPREKLDEESAGAKLDNPENGILLKDQEEVLTKPKEELSDKNIKLENPKSVTLLVDQEKATKKPRKELDEESSKLEIGASKKTKKDIQFTFDLWKKTDHRIKVKQQDAVRSSKYICPIPFCYKKFPTLLSRDDHSNSHVRKFVCKLCNGNYSTAKSFRLHFRRNRCKALKDDKNKLPCKYCFIVAPNKEVHEKVCPRRVNYDSSWRTYLK
ncbi:unnamed protein product [Orchesella dallaii]|uniref:C2H2-type domain-containing protein n=1 Tax=Orchesella dallaii TaxID=48710 RepID=A0ABP1RYY1_9HEXA